LWDVFILVSFAIGSITNSGDDNMQLIESPINYMGSKYKLLPNLIKLFPQKQYFYDVFTGGGSVYMNVAHIYPNVIANDLISDLIKIHENLNNLDFIDAAAQLSVPTKHSQEAFLRLRNNYNTNSSPAQLLALIWSCNSNMMRFNQSFQFNQTWGQRCYNENTRKKWELFRSKNITNVIFENKHFTEYSSIANDNVFLYLDPPYSNTEAGYNVFWSSKDENNLISMVKGFVANKIAFGLSGVLNEKINCVYNELCKESVVIYYFGDFYQKVSKKARANVEYYITNVFDKNIDVFDRLDTILT